MLQIGDTINSSYKIIREIGRGGTSCVYLAENIRLHSYWAIKEVYKDVSTGDGIKSQMLIAESNLLTKLKHPGLPMIVDVMDTTQSCLIVMEYIDGVSLDKVLEKKGACSQDDVLKWALQLCDVLSYLHGQNPPIVYRDMKPANVMLRPDGSITLIDFGLARKFKPNSQHDTSYFGTHGYAAPEQYSDTRQSDARTDIYSLGVTLYHLVTGDDPCVPPYGIGSICEVNPYLSQELDQIIKKCTQLEPEDRYQTAEQLKADLKAVASGDYEGIRPKKKNNWMWGLLAIPALIILVVCSIIAINANEDSDSDKDVSYINAFSGEETDETANNNPQNAFIRQEVIISEPGEELLLDFVPEVTGYYDIYSISDDAVPVIFIYDDKGELIEKYNTFAEKGDFFANIKLVAGKKYQFVTKLYDLKSTIPATGTYWIYVEYEK